MKKKTTKKKIVRAAFDKGQKPIIACVNLSKQDFGDFSGMVTALQSYANNLLYPAWRISCRLVITTKPSLKNWNMIFVDDADAANALGYHEYTAYGVPISYVFIDPTLNSGLSVSSVASHELAEMIVDPAINLWSDSPSGKLYAYEVCDAVEEEEFQHLGYTMSDFVFPSYFEGFRTPSSDQFDYLNKVTKPFQILPGGYSIVRNGTRIYNIYGSKSKEKRFAKEDRRLHRSEHRKRIIRGK